MLQLTVKTDETQDGCGVDLRGAVWDHLDSRRNERQPKSEVEL